MKDSRNTITWGVDNSLPQSPDFTTTLMITPDIPPLSHPYAIAESIPGNKREEEEKNSKKKKKKRNHPNEIQAPNPNTE